MEECLGIFKTSQTMYLEYDNGYWSYDKPYDGKYKHDYELMRVGTVLRAYKLQECEIFDGETHYIGLCNNKNGIVYFKDMEDVHKCLWLYEVKQGEKQ